MLPLLPDRSPRRGQYAAIRDHPHRRRILMEAMDNINFSQRDDIVKYVDSGLTRNWKMRQEMRSKRFTTRWDELYEVP